MEISWRVSLGASSLHAAHAVASGRSLVDPRLAEALSPAAHHLREEIEAIPIPPGRVWRHLLPLSADFADPRELARRTLVKATGGGLPVQIERIASRLLEVELALKQAVVRPGSPSPLEELRLRERPLRELFEARGPGLLRAVGELTDPDLIAGHATVLTVHPVLGGGGEAHLEYNSVRIEALLANARQDLPEVLRLGWLLSQLQQDVPGIGEGVHRDRLPQVAALAMLPAALAAGERVELARCDVQMAAAAIEAWRIDTPPAWSSDPAGNLWTWWESYRAARPAWPVALAALDKLMAG